MESECNGNLTLCQVNLTGRFRSSLPEAARSTSARLQTDIVTIAAGFRFSDGIVVCADSEESSEAVKKSVPKIEIFDRKYGRSIVTGAGDADMLNRAFEEIESQVQARDSFSAARDTVEAIVQRLNQRYVYPVTGEDQPVFALLVALQTKGSFDFFTIGLSASVRPKDHAEIGVGDVHASHLMARFYRPNMTQDDAVLLAIYMLQQTKRYVPGCGGDSHIYIMRTDGRIDSVAQATIEAHERYADRFNSALHEAFFGGVNASLNDAQFRRVLSASVRSLLKLRNSMDPHRPFELKRILGPSKTGRRAAR
jgi:20S proteasome alpha/beta subunit